LTIVCREAMKKVQSPDTLELKFGFKNALGAEL